MRTVLLAAGLSRRLGALTKNKTKCLLKVGKETMLRRTIRSCMLAGLDNLLVVTGHGAEYVNAEIAAIREAGLSGGLTIDTLFNPKYETINNCYSLLMGLPETKESTIIINSDDVFDDRILQGIARDGPTVLVIDNVKQLTEESMKACVERELIRRIGKHLDVDTSAGEYIGLARIADKDIQGLRDALQYVVDHNPDGFYEEGFDIICEQTEVRPWYTDGLQWVEIDTEEDLSVARNLVKRGPLS
ncbi:MAG: phosphocholine cytidylyltransferase family protein [Planctomycetia bacterium]|nr:phosphocholine cytidylyltransferase family protein [Planctomycetia bacterium]